MEILRSIFGSGHETLESLVEKRFALVEKHGSKDDKILAGISSIVTDELDITRDYLEKLRDGIIPWNFYSFHQNKIEEIRRNVTKTKIFPIKEDIVIGLNTIDVAFQPSDSVPPLLGYDGMYQNYPISARKALTPEEEATKIVREVNRYAAILASLRSYVF